MGTRSTIALEFADGTVGQVYCHWDGYLSHNGRILLDHYTDPFKVRELIDNGDISSLGSEIGVKHDFDPPAWNTPAHHEYAEKYGNMTKFYMRDRGEEGCGATYFKDFSDYEKNHGYQEYEYILRQVNGEAVWYVNQGHGYEPLMEAYIEQMRQDAEEEETE
jgi:hypothetical protein